MRVVLMSLVILVCAACGPPRLSAGTSSDETSDGGSNDGESSDGDPSDDESSDSSTNTNSIDTGPTNSTDTNSTDTNSTGSTHTTEFVPLTDFLEQGECDSFQQDCPEGEKCVPYSSSAETWDHHKCVPVLGEQATGEPCVSGGWIEATDDCDATGFCWDGLCHSFCTGSLDIPECPEGYECLLSSDPVVTLCFLQCDPVAQDCADGLACYWTGTALSCVPTANPPGLAPGQPCEFVNECEAGSLCLDASVMPDCEGTGCCGSFCDLGLGDAQCAAVPGTTCVPFWEQGMAPAGFEHVGACIVGP